MKEKKDKLYQQYLKERLHLIFKDFKNPNLPLIVHDELYNLENADGKLICDKWYTKISEYKDGYALAYDGKRYNFLDINGKPLCEDGFEYAHSFSYGYALIKLNGKYNYIDTNGKLIKEDAWYDLADDFVNGFAMVGIPKWNERDNGLYMESTHNFIDINGNLISDEWFDDAKEFHEGFAAVKKDGAWYFINSSGKPAFETCYYDVGYFVNGYARVCKNGMWNWINTKGELLRKNHWFYGATNFKYGYAIYCPNEYNLDLIDKSGNIINNNYYDDICIYKNRIVVEKDGRYAEIDKNGDLITKWYSDKKLLEYRAKKTLTGYTFRTQYGEFKTLYAPCDVINKTFILCKQVRNNKNSLCYLYNTEKDEYTCLGYFCDIVRNESIIYDKSREKHYLVYGNGFYDITEYYDRYLISKEEAFVKPNFAVYQDYGKENRDVTDRYAPNLDGYTSIHVNPGIEILSEEEFYKKNKKETLKAQENEDDSFKVEDLRRQNEEKEKLLEEKKNEVIEGLKVLVKTLEGLEKEKGLRDKVQINNLFVDVSDHKEIYLETNMLRFFDLSNHSFTNAKISGIDFRGCVINLNPQEVYNKDLSNCNFEGVFFPVSTDFTGVNICGSRFSTNNNPTVFDINYYSFVNAIYDDNTTLDGIPLQMIYESINTGKGSK